MVMGMTGSGKSTFVSHLTGHPPEDVGVGHGLGSSQSFTSMIRSRTNFLPLPGTTSAIKYTANDGQGLEVCVLDTPGFGDTTRSDAEILNEIAGQLVTLHKNCNRLLGIIYLHRITDVRLSNSALRSFNILRELCGESYNSVIFATTMWSGPNSSSADRQDEEERQEQLEAYWDSLFRGKGRTARHDKPPGSAWDIIKCLLGISQSGNINTLTLKIQDEMSEQNKTLDQTSAGRYLQQEAARADGDTTEGDPQRPIGDSTATSNGGSGAALRDSDDPERQESAVSNSHLNLWICSIFYPLYLYLLQALNWWKNWRSERTPSRGQGSRPDSELDENLAY